MIMGALILRFLNRSITMKPSPPGRPMSKMIALGFSLLAIIIAVVVVINEIAYVGTTSLAWVVIGLAVAVGALAIYLLVEKK